MLKLFLSLCFLALFSGFNAAQASEWVENEHFRSRIAALPDGGNTLAVLEIELEEGWHTYGQEPGDAGLPPHFDWGASENLEKLEMTWPEPIHKRELDMFDINAYENLVSFPLAIIPVDAGVDVALDLDLQIMICHEICIPDQAHITALLKPGYPAPVVP